MVARDNIVKSTHRPWWCLPPHFQTLKGVSYIIERGGAARPARHPPFRYATAPLRTSKYRAASIIIAWGSNFTTLPHATILNFGLNIIPRVANLVRKSREGRKVIKKKMMPKQPFGRNLGQRRVPRAEIDDGSMKFLKISINFCKKRVIGAKNIPKISTSVMFNLGRKTSREKRPPTFNVM